jgi:hypothetical protein
MRERYLGSLAKLDISLHVENAPLCEFPTHDKKCRLKNEHQQIYVTFEMIEGMFNNSLQ